VPPKREQFVRTIRAQALGVQMRELRDARGLTLDYVAAYLGVQLSTLARYERAEWPFRREHVKALLDVYGVFVENERERLLTLAEDAWRIDQWEQDNTIGPPNLTVVDHWWLQQRAIELRVYASVLIPPLLWTRDYAEAVIRANSGPQAHPSTVEKLVRQRLDRQRILDDKPGTRMTILMEEHVLRQPIGGRAVLREQLEHLGRTAERPHVTVRLVPPTNWHAGMYGAFTLCMMGRPYPTVALLEHLRGRLALEADTAKLYEEAFEHIGGIALDTEDSVKLITEEALA
jgi:transcriptional regulator with XRE-family HTH domain